MKLIHWEHDKDNEGEPINEESKLELGLGIIWKDKVKTGFHCRWHSRLVSEKGMFLNCIIEDPFYSNKNDNLTMEGIRKSVDESLKRFNEYLNLHLVAYEVDLSFVLTDDPLVDFLIELNRL